MNIREKLKATNKFWDAVQYQNYHIKGLIDQLKRQEDKLVSVNTPLVQIFIGAKGSGKTTLCQKKLKLKRIDFAYLRFKDEGLRELKPEDFDELFEAVRVEFRDPWLIIDEPQYVKYWTLFVKWMLERGFRVIITSTDARLLEEAPLASLLKGRCRVTRLQPLGFRDYCFFKLRRGCEYARRYHFRWMALQDYVYSGGLPGRFSRLVMDKPGYADKLYEEIVDEAAARSGIRDAETFKRMAARLAREFDFELNYKQLSRRFGLGSEHTARKYVDALKRSCILEGVPRYSLERRKRDRGEKAYLADAAFIQKKGTHEYGDEYDLRLMKNAVCTELLRQTRNSSMSLSYFRGEGYEIDFVVCRGERVVQLIDVTFRASDIETVNNKLSELRRGGEELKCENLTLMVVHETARELTRLQGVDMVSVTEWLYRAAGMRPSMKQPKVKAPKKGASGGRKQSGSAQ